MIDTKLRYRSQPFFLSLCVLSLNLLIYSVITTSYARNDTVFTIAKFTVEASAKNAVEAKQQALAQGQIDAFKKLLRRLTTFSNYQRLPEIDPTVINKTLDGFSVRNERNSRVQYLATLDFKFRAQAVRNLLRQYNIPHLEEQSEAIVVLPIFYGQSVANTETAFSSRYEETLEDKDKKSLQSWRKGWSSLDLKHALTPIELVQINSDLTREKIKALLDGEAEETYAVMRDDYLSQSQSTYFILAISYIDTSTNALMVHLIGEDPADALNLKNSYALDTQNPDKTFQNAAELSLRVIETRWKLKRSTILGTDAQAAKPESFVMTVRFSNLQQWQMIRQKLNDIPGIGDIEVGSLSARGAEITLNFPGGAERFGHQVSSHDLILENLDGAWILKTL